MSNRFKILFFLLLLTPLLCEAQEDLEIQSFALSRTDRQLKKDQRVDYNGTVCALVKVKMPDDIDRVDGNVIGEILDKGDEKWIYLTRGTKQFEIFPKNHFSILVLCENYEISELQSKRVYKLIIKETGAPDIQEEPSLAPVIADVAPQVINSSNLQVSSQDTIAMNPMVKKKSTSSCFYIQPAIQAGTMIGFGGNIGFYVSNFNMEGFVTTTLGKETISMYNKSTFEESQANLSGLMIGGKIGYGINVGQSVRITPQVGAGALSISGDGWGSSAISATASIRVEIAFSRNFGVSLTPEGQFAVSKNEVFKKFEEVSSKIKGWGTGANLRVGLYLKF